MHHSGHYRLLFQLVLILFAYISTGDIAGLVGGWSAVGFSYAYVNPGRARSVFQRARLHVEGWWIRWKIDRMRKKRDFRIVQDDERSTDGAERKGNGEDRGGNGEERGLAG